MKALFAAALAVIAATAVQPAPAATSPTLDLDISHIHTVVNDAAGWQTNNMPETGRHRLVNPAITGWADGVFLGALALWADYDDSRGFAAWTEEIAEEQYYEVGHHSFQSANDISIGMLYGRIWQRTEKPHRLVRTVDSLTPENIRLMAGGWVPLHPTIARLDYQMKIWPTEEEVRQYPVAKNGRWSWPDALYMAAPVYALFANITGNAAYRDHMDREFWRAVDEMYDEEEHLFHQSQWARKHREPNGRKRFWGRGNGWVAAAIPQVLDELPDDYPTRPRYEELFREMMARVVELQGEDGYWRSSMLDPESFPDPETSATGFFTYALLWGINDGLLDEAEYLAPALRGWRALEAAVHEDGKLGYVQEIGGGPVTGITADSHESYGTAALILAGYELCRYLEAREPHAD